MTIQTAQCQSVGDRLQKCVRLFRYSNWLPRESIFKQDRPDRFRETASYIFRRKVGILLNVTAYQKILKTNNYNSPPTKK